MASMEIIQLIERCRQGDTTALGELYQTYAKQMKGVCRRYRLDEQSVNDVLHDSFVIIYTSLDKLRDNSKAQAWMMSITRNVASKYKDYQKSHRTVSLDGLGSNNLLDEDTLEKEFTGLSLAELTVLINKLPEGYGKIFRLAVFEGLSHKEIAAMKTSFVVVTIGTSKKYVAHDDSKILASITVADYSYSIPFSQK